MLARECEALLKSAQTQIDEAMPEPEPADAEHEALEDDELDSQIPF